MKLEDYRNAYYELTGKASDITRQLCLAGIAIIWASRYSIKESERLPCELTWPAIFIISALMLDFMQYMVASSIYGSFIRKKEKEGVSEDQEVDHPAFYNYPAVACFWLKGGATIISYFMILKYLFIKYVFTV